MRILLGSQNVSEWLLMTALPYIYLNNHWKYTLKIDDLYKYIKFASTKKEKERGVGLP